MRDETVSDALVRELKSARKIEWGVILALTVNVVTAAFGVGVYFNTITEQGRRIEALEKDRMLTQAAMSQQSQLLTKIDATVQFLKERAEEDRRVIYERRGL